jgi:hypothetical protein
VSADVAATGNHRAIACQRRPVRNPKSVRTVVLIEIMRRLWTDAAVAAVLALTAMAACGGGDAQPDAGTDPPDAEPAPDANPYPACSEFGAPMISVSELPLTYEGDLAGSGADIAGPESCLEIDAPFGMSSTGADAVVEVDSLTPGVDYVVRLTGSDDLAFYVVTGCATELGPAADQCLVFVDATTDTAEVGRFVAPETGRAYVVVDYWTSGYPDPSDFRLEVYPLGCQDSTECGGSTPVCQDFRCVGCANDFDCTDPSAPLCDEPTFTCVEGLAGCTSDDSAEDGNDGPAGATELVPGQLTQAAICDNPRAERDFYRFHVDQNGEHWTIQLSWSASVDLDVTVFDDDGDLVGMSWYEQPERIELTYLPAGDYYAMVDYFATTQTSVSTPYAISATRLTGDSCIDEADCAVEYRNQVFRGDCFQGACRPIDGQGLRTIGESCDSVSDCTPDANCSSFFFTADADQRMVCGNFCDSDLDCTGLGSDFVCTTYLVNNFCVQRCTQDDHCPTSPTTQPTFPPWHRLTCQLSTGRCLPP